MKEKNEIIVSVRIPKNIFKKLEEISIKEERSKAYILRKAVIKYLEEMNKNVNTN